MMMDTDLLAIVVAVIGAAGAVAAAYIGRQPAPAGTPAPGKSRKWIRWALIGVTVCCVGLLSWKFFRPCRCEKLYIAYSNAGLSEVLRASRQYFLDDFHWPVSGNATVSEILKSVTAQTNILEPRLRSYNEQIERCRRIYGPVADGLCDECMSVSQKVNAGVLDPLRNAFKATNVTELQILKPKLIIEMQSLADALNPELNSPQKTKSKNGD